MCNECTTADSAHLKPYSRLNTIDSPDIVKTDPATGGRKGTKLARFDLIPWDAIKALAEHYGIGARKYEDRNWELGYPWSWSFAALHRHLEAWWDGEENDPESGDSHLIAVAWHAVCLWWLQKHQKGTDDRPLSRKEL